MTRKFLSGSSTSLIFSNGFPSTNSRSGSTCTATENAITKQFNTAECKVYKTDSVKVNPQYGRLDFSSYTVVASPDTLSAAGGAAPKTSTTGASPSC